MYPIKHIDYAFGFYLLIIILLHQIGQSHDNELMIQYLLFDGMMINVYND